MLIFSLSIRKNTLNIQWLQDFFEFFIKCFRANIYSPECKTSSKKNYKKKVLKEKKNIG